MGENERPTEVYIEGQKITFSEIPYIKTILQHKRTAAMITLRQPFQIF